jgi:ribonuclease P protein subunit POP4
MSGVNLIMPVTEKNVLKHELIGLEVSVLESPNSSEIGKKGMIVQETKNMIVIQGANKDTKIQKKDRKFVIKLPDGKKVKVLGNKILFRSEDRIKKKVKKWH